MEMLDRICSVAQLVKNRHYTHRGVWRCVKWVNERNGLISSIDHGNRRTTCDNVLLMNGIRLALCAFVTLATLIPVRALAQTEGQLDQIYTKLKVYAVRPNISLMAKFGGDGRVCEMALEPRRYDGDKVTLLSNLPEQEIVDIIEEVVPESDRGRRLEGGGFSKWLKSDISGDTIFTTYRYENMTIQVSGTIRKKDSERMAAAVTFSQRSCN
jgi:hypothetical protein